jgi:amino acid adenylation domain-containing protein
MMSTDNVPGRDDIMSSAGIGAIYQALNATRDDRFSPYSIIDLFERQVHDTPDATALVHAGAVMTYRDLNQKSNQVAQFLSKRSIRAGSVVGVLADKSNELICWILGILKTGAAYLPINSEYPEARIRYVLDTANVAMLISEAKHKKLIDRLQWLCGSLDAYVCLGTDAVDSVREPDNVLMDANLWEYVGTNATNDITGGGWLDSYTGDQFSRDTMDEYADNALKKLKPYLTSTTKVLEIGCASGISMFRIAPHVGEYWGTDLSQIIIGYNQVICEERGITNIQLRTLAAGEISQIDARDFDVVIINSVIQCFSGYNYLRNVIADAIDLMKPNGVLFVGDVMDLELRDDLTRSLNKFKELNPDKTTRVDVSDELFASRGFWNDLRFKLRTICDVDCSLKIGTLKNELTEYRYDVLLFVDKARANEEPPGKQNKYQFDRRVLDGFSSDTLDVVVSPETVSNVIFTSGSTGDPKGVMVCHRGLVRLVKDSRFIAVKPGAHWLHTADLSFDPSTMELFAALLNGATLHLFTKEDLLDIRKLKDYIRAHKISIMQLITPIFHEVVLSDPEVFETLDRLIVGGEAMLPRLAGIVKETCPGVTLINAYGPTENTVVSTFFKVEGDHESMPIGIPVANSEVYIFDRDMNLQPVSIAGELYLGGDGLSPGYLNDTVLTDEKFLDHPFRPGKKLFKTGDSARLRQDGTVEFLGRLDNQVKVRGYRIELSEIEKAILSVYGVENAVVTLLSRADEKFICAYVVAFNDAVLEEVKGSLGRKLPAYMVPAFFARLDKLPLTRTGKVDKKMLPMPDSFIAQSRAEYIAPRSEVERKLVEIWQDVLDEKMIGVRDNFFSLGGNSLKVIKLLKIIEEFYPGMLEISDMFSYSTVEAQAARIDSVIAQATPGTIAKEIEF